MCCFKKYKNTERIQDTVWDDSHVVIKVLVHMSEFTDVLENACTVVSIFFQLCILAA